MGLVGLGRGAFAGGLLCLKSGGFSGKKYVMELEPGLPPLRLSKLLVRASS